MIDLYFWMTPNGYKISILLEELALPYRVIPIHIGKGEQFAEDFLRINPNGKIPAITDPNGSDGAPISIFESGAIMIYLANRYGKQFLPDRERDHYAVLQWLMFQMGGVGPMLGQAHHFRKYAPTQIDYAIERYTREATRLYTVIEKRLRESEYLAGSYSIADMAVYPWIRPYRWQGQELSDYPAIQRWYQRIHDRPAVERGVAVLKDRLDHNRAKPTGDNWNILFGGRTPATKE